MFPLFLFRQMTNIGILLPRSSYYQSIGFDIYNGLKLGLKHLDRDEVRILTENVGFGADKNTVYRAAERLILEEDCSIVLAYISHRSANLLRPLFMSTNRILIVLDAGVNLPQEWPSTPNIVFHSLHNCLGAWLTGKLAAESGHKVGGMVTGYYDGGYLHTAALTEGFVQHGGKIEFNHATGYKTDDFSMEPLKNLTREDNNTCLLSLFSGDFNEWFLRDIHEIFPENTPPIYKATFALEESMLEKTPYTTNSIRGITSWTKKLNNPENIEFIQTMKDAGFEANLFSLLGWEIALMSTTAIDLMLKHKNNGREVTNLLKESSYQTPRGTLKFHNESNTTLSPMYKVEVVDNGLGYNGIEIIDEVPNIEYEYEKMSSINLNGAISGWYNSYTCN